VTGLLTSTFSVGHVRKLVPRASAVSHETVLVAGQPQSTKYNQNDAAPSRKRDA
jgi:hypothetical protein